MASTSSRKGPAALGLASRETRHRDKGGLVLGSGGRRPAHRSTSRRAAIGGRGWGSPGNRSSQSRPSQSGGCSHGIRGSRVHRDSQGLHFTSRHGEHGSSNGDVHTVQVDPVHGRWILPVASGMDRRLVDASVTRSLSASSSPAVGCVDREQGSCRRSPRRQPAHQDRLHRGWQQVLSHAWSQGTWEKRHGRSTRHRRNSIHEGESQRHSPRSRRLVRCGASPDVDPVQWIQQRAVGVRQDLHQVRPGLGLSNVQKQALSVTRRVGDDVGVGGVTLAQHGDKAH